MSRALLKSLLPARAAHALRMMRARRRGEPELAWVAGLRPGLAIDVGANLGFYAATLARGGARVHAFEPNAALAGYLRKVLPGSVEVHALGLSDRAGRAELHIPLDARGIADPGLASMEPGNDLDGSHTQVLEVPTARLDDLADALGGPVGLIKIDVEGHEQAVLDGACGLIARDRPMLLVETEQRHGADVPALFAGLTGMGYRAHLWREGRLHPLGPDEFLARQHAGVPGQAGYVNNAIFLPAA